MKFAQKAINSGNLHPLQRQPQGKGKSVTERNHTCLFYLILAGHALQDQLRNQDGSALTSSPCMLSQQQPELQLQCTTQSQSYFRGIFSSETNKKRPWLFILDFFCQVIHTTLPLLVFLTMAMKSKCTND